MGKPSMHVFIVDVGPLPTLNAHRIEAAYYRHDDDFTTFKDADGQQVYTVHNSQLLSVERADDATPISDLRELLKTADTYPGPVSREFVTRETDPDGGVRETVYEVTVKAV